MKNECGRTCRKRRLKKLNCSSHVINYNDIYILSKWMGKRGYKPLKNLRPMLFKDTGRGLMAGEAVNVDDVIISIPGNLLITPKSVLTSDLGPFLEKHCPKASGQEILSIFLVCEHAKGKSSEWYPYISSLPQAYSTPAYFCQHSMTMLPKSIYASATKQCESIKNSFLHLIPLLDELKNIYPVCKDINYDIFKWAWCSVNTRCIFMECGDKDCSGKLCSYHLALAPFLDLLNHSTDVQVSAGFNKENNCYEIISHNKFKRYSQVFISYGCHDNQKLFLEYGFVIQNNYNDYIAFSLDDILSAYDFCNLPLNNLPQKLKFIKDKKLLRNTVLSLDGISWNLSIIMKILISNYDIRLWNSLFHGCKQETDDLEFQNLKRFLVNIKMSDYKLPPLCLNCCECSSHQCLISNLYSSVRLILIKALS